MSRTQTIADRIIRALSQFAESLKKHPAPKCCDCESAILDVRVISLKPVKTTARNAYCWSCNECWETNFGEPIVHEFADGEKEKYYREHSDLSEWDELPEDWDLFMVGEIPEHVQCGKCGARHILVE